MPELCNKGGLFARGQETGWPVAQAGQARPALSSRTLRVNGQGWRYFVLTLKEPPQDATQFSTSVRLGKFPLPDNNRLTPYPHGD